MHKNLRHITHQLPHLVASLRQHYNNMRKRTREYAPTIEYGAHLMLRYNGNTLHIGGENLMGDYAASFDKGIATKYATTSEYYCWTFVWEKLLYHAVFLQ